MELVVAAWYREGTRGHFYLEPQRSDIFSVDQPKTIQANARSLELSGSASLSTKGNQENRG